MVNGFQKKTSVLKTISPELRQSLNALNLIEFHEKALFFTTDDEIENARIDNKFSIVFALEKAKKKVNASAVFFKIFKDRPPKPQIYIFDFSHKSCIPLEEELGKIHKEVWNTCEVPLIYIFTNTEIKIINCMKHPVKKDQNLIPDYLEKSIPIQEILNNVSIVNDILKKYSARLFINGSFWEDKENEKHFVTKDTANEFLLENLINFRNKLLKGTKLRGNIKVINKVLIQCILLKYLEERKDINNNHVFPSDFFKKFNNANCFCDVLENGSFLELCDNLEQKFNGKVFQWINVKERNLLDSLKFTEIADFLNADQDVQGQQWLWRLYSFNHLPVELISHIYDHFLGENKEGKVYTPIHLANLLIDQSMPLDINIKDIPDLSNYKILDPSCGSGVFLVLAFKRLVQWWTIKNYNETKNWSLPDSKTIKLLISRCLYGVDIDKEAVQLTVFSLSLALCDMLSPPEIWNKLKFEDLTDKNIIEIDFFKYLSIKSEKFNLIIGNPPFKSEFTTKDAKQIEDKRTKKLNLPKTPDKQLAFLFMEQSLKLLKEDMNSLLCLIIPYSFIYSNAKEYRKYILKYNVVQIIDFSHISDILFPKVNYPVLGIFINNHETLNENILHLVIKRTKIHKEKIYFEIDEYDFHFVNKKTATEDDFIWKCNLLGGGRIYRLIKYLKQERTFKDYLIDKKKENGWYYGQGYTIGHNGNKSNEELDKIFYRNRKRYYKADYITGKRSLDSDYFTEDGINEDGIYIEKEIYFEWPRDERLYKSPHLLIKEYNGKKSIPIEFINEYLIFKDSIFGIHAPERDIQELKKIEKRFKNNQLFRFIISCISNSSLTSSSEYRILNQDIMNLPYPEDEKKLYLSESEQIIVDDVLKYIIKSQSNEGENKLTEKITDSHLKIFSKLFCNTLNSVYHDNDKKFRQGKITETPAFICNSFIYGYKEVNDDIRIDKLAVLEKNLQELINNQVGEALYINRIIRIYDKDIIYLIKPNQLRYWLGSIALRDADKIFSDLLEDGN